MKHVSFKLILIFIIAGILRMPFLDKIPPSLYSDEISQGYNAYSVLRTGKDEYGTFLPVSFRSFGDWKPPLQTYLMVPTIAIFGLNEYGVRLPSALLGTLTVLLMYFLAKEIVRLDKRLERFSESISLMSAGFLAVSGWHILQSRSAMLVAVTLFFFTAGLLFFFKGLRTPKWWYLSALSFCLAVYGYYGMRVTVPILLLFLLLAFRENIAKQRKTVFIGIIVGALALLPLAVAFVKEPDVVFGRAKTVSVFYDQGVALTVWDLIAQDGVKMSPLLAQFFHNKPYHYTLSIIERFFEHLSGQFLFLIGDQNPPFQIPNMGVLHFFDVVLLPLGILVMVKRKSPVFKILGMLIITSILPAALTFVTPASNRTLPLVLPFSMLSAVGMFCIWEMIRAQKSLQSKSTLSFSLFGLTILMYLVGTLYFNYQYFVVLPQKHASWWHFGTKDLYRSLIARESEYETIFVSGKIGVAYIYQLFYRQIDPVVVAANIRRNYRADEFGFEHVDGFGTYEFPRDFDWEADGDSLPAHSLLVTTATEKVGSRAEQIDQILLPNGEIAYRIYRIN